MDLAVRIERLSDNVINQIAAGEVVERPASLVKELTENSLDAEASRIEVTLENGGMSLVSVLDDGVGIAKEDLGLVLERHATSKLREAVDLQTLYTYGFRGEALASIAAVSEIEIRTRTKNQDQGYNFLSSFGVLKKEPSPVGCPPGTEISVRNLFAEIPARQKFLRSAGTEFSHCAQVIREEALSAPTTKFILRHQGRVVHEYVASSAKDRVLEALRPSWTPIEVEEATDEFSFKAYTSPPEWIQSRGEIFLFINGRCVRNRALLSAIRGAYLETLGKDHDPSGAYYLEIRRDWVDPNAHPQKLEVRCLRQERLVGWLRAVLRKAISIRPMPRIVELEAPPLREVSYSEPEQVSFVADRAEIPRSSPIPMPAGLAQPPASLRYNRLAPDTPALRYPLRYLGQAKAAYLVCEDNEGLLVVDQHALHEKMRFEELEAQFEKEGAKAQRLLVPLVLSGFSGKEAIIEENASWFLKLGFEIEPFGNGDIVVKTRPDLLLENQIESVIRDAIQSFEEGSEDGARDRAFRRVLATLACHSVVRAGQRLSLSEVAALLSGLDKLEAGWTCPHGRPVALRFGFPLIEKHFERT